MTHELTTADLEIQTCLDEKQSFAVIAGAGSGKTTSLVDALKHVRAKHGRKLRRDGQKVVCITYTKRARDVLRHRLNDDDLFEVSTIHSFLWNEVSRYSQDIAAVIAETIIPGKIAKYNEDASGTSQKAERARANIVKLEEALPHVSGIAKFDYDDGKFSDFKKGTIGHDDVIDIATAMICSRPLLQKIIGQKYPYTFVDEAQDTFPVVVEALNQICSGDGLPIVGYFGDPMQQIYEKRAGQFKGPPGYKVIAKEQNFRSARSVIELANKLRDNLQQVPAGPNAEIEGDVTLILVAAEEPGAPRKRYTDEQLDRALSKLDAVLAEIGWQDHEGSKRLYLARQMIARRLGFLELHRLFDGEYASQRVKDEFEEGNHFLIKPIVETLWPIANALEKKDELGVLKALRTNSPAFDISGDNAGRPLKHMLAQAKIKGEGLLKRWKEGTIKDVLSYGCEEGLYSLSERLAQQLNRDPRPEAYNKDEHGAERSDWLADTFFQSTTSELSSYAEFVTDNTPFSTQHGVKGEEYDDVLVLFDDVEAAWSMYSFAKLFAPGVAGEGTSGQIERSLRLAYVCFTRAQKTLRIVLFCPSPGEAKTELVAKGWLYESQIRIFPV